MSFYFRQEWTDPRLIVNASDSNFTTASIGFSDVSRLWLPDVYFSNSKEDRKHDVTVPNQLLYVTINTGRVLYSQRSETGKKRVGGGGGGRREEERGKGRETAGRGRGE